MLPPRPCQEGDLQQWERAMIIDRSAGSQPPPAWPPLPSLQAVRSLGRSAVTAVHQWAPYLPSFRQAAPPGASGSGPAPSAP